MPITEHMHEIRRKQGQAFSAWLKTGMTDRVTGLELTPTDVARLLGLKSSSYIRVLLNDCYDEGEKRIKIPEIERIDALAKLLGLNANEGRRAAGRPLKEDAIDPGLRYLRTGDFIRINPDDPDPDTTVRATEAFLSAWRKVPHKSE